MNSHSRRITTMTTKLVEQVGLASAILCRYCASTTKEILPSSTIKSTRISRAVPTKKLKKLPYNKIRMTNLQNKLMFGELLESKAQKIRRVKEEAVCSEAVWLEVEEEKDAVVRQQEAVSNDSLIDYERGKELEKGWMKQSSSLKVLSVAPHVEPKIISLPYPRQTEASLLPRYPSVTKILSATVSPERRAILDNWEKMMIKKLGEDGFKEYKEGILTNGKELHGNIREVLTGTSEDRLIFREAIEGHWTSLKHIVHEMKRVHVLESHVVHPRLQYCGIVDCVAEYQGRLVLIDWKTAEKAKPVVTMTYDTPIQIAAYIGAMKEDPNYTKKVREGLIVIGYKSGLRGEVFHLSQSSVATYWVQWLARLKLFRKLQEEAEEESTKS